jgi:serine protease inhibitor
MKWSLNAVAMVACAATASLHAAESDLAATATNQLGIDLHRQLASGDENLCVSPYSIQSALAMTFAGSDGETRSEMAHVLHFPNKDDNIHASFSSLRDSLEETAKKSATLVEQTKGLGGPSEPITLSIANRLFAQSGYDFRERFRKFVQKYYGAPFEPLDFRKDAGGATQQINKWVADQTRDRIRDLIPAGALNEMTRLVLANAIYLKAAWAHEFNNRATRPAPFHVRGGTGVDVPMMRRQDRQFGYAKQEGFTAVSLPYVGNELQFVVLVPDEVSGLHAFESRLTAEILSQCAKLEPHDVDLSMPKFKFEPPTILLGERLQALGMKSAFDQPRGSANFERIAPRKPNDYLYVSQVFHKTFIAVDEKGTEAAAATAVAMATTSAMAKKAPPIEVKVDRPFVYAIQHVPSGACLFIGRVTDPR